MGSSFKVIPLIWDTGSGWIVIESYEFLTCNSVYFMITAMIKVQHSAEILLKQAKETTALLRLLDFTHSLILFY